MFLRKKNTKNNLIKTQDGNKVRVHNSTFVDKKCNGISVSSKPKNYETLNLGTVTDRIMGEDAEGFGHTFLFRNVEESSFSTDQELDVDREWENTQISKVLSVRDMFISDINEYSTQNHPISAHKTLESDIKLLDDRIEAIERLLSEGDLYSDKSDNLMALSEFIKTLSEKIDNISSKFELTGFDIIVVARCCNTIGLSNIIMAKVMALLSMNLESSDAVLDALDPVLNEIKDSKRRNEISRCIGKILKEII